MKAAIQFARWTLPKHPHGEQGMSLVEMIFAMMMLVAFGAVLVAATQFIARFMNQAQASFNKDEPTGTLIDQHQLQLAMDRMADVLSQPGFSKDELQAIVGNPQKACASDPWQEWGMPGKRMPARADYRFCLRSTSLTEPALTSILSAGVAEKPGIYVIQALPSEVTASSLPARRLFCRPKPFC